uniref:CM0545.270.nc protein n=1 Tax=Lotus japonicus TaxID=34305 RepID=B0BLB4_LOTJA|nr:CM0545.270.nc [Lotus japonicus]
MEHTEAGTVQAVLFQEEAVETIKGTQKMEPSEAGTVQMSDNVVLRKLLRGPRYYDPPADCGWETCYNCGEEGHATVKCAAAKELKKPCYLCGSLMHQAKRCKKEIQCYVCKSFGHLCCANTTGSTPIEISCYKCGQTGHTGLARCSHVQGKNFFTENAGVMVKEEVRKRGHTLSNTESPTFQKENGYMGDRSAPHDMGMPYMEKKPLTEERAITTQQPSKHRGGCREDQAMLFITGSQHLGIGESEKLQQVVAFQNSGL